MIIPITKGQATAPGAPTQGMPSETNLLMALATMHEQGRFQVAGDVVQGPSQKRLFPEQAVDIIDHIKNTMKQYDPVEQDNQPKSKSPK